MLKSLFYINTVVYEYLCASYISNTDLNTDLKSESRMLWAYISGGRGRGILKMLYNSVITLVAAALDVAWRSVGG